MVDGASIWWPAYIMSISKPNQDQTVLAAENLTYASGTDKNDYFYDVKHGSALFVSHPSVQQAKAAHSIEIHFFAGVFHRSPPIHQKNRRKCLICGKTSCLKLLTLRVTIIGIPEVRYKIFYIDLKEDKHPTTRTW